MKVSLLVITNRPGGMDILRANVRRQTQKPDQVVLVDALYDQRAQPVQAFFDGLKIRHIPDPPKEGICNIEPALNEGLAHCKGDLVVFLQDYIWIPRQGIKRFVQGQNQLGDCLISGVGNVGAEPAEADDPSGLLSVFGRDYTEMPEGVSWADPRITYERGWAHCEPVAWEANWGCAPREVIEAVGGFDEAYRDGWAFGNADFAYRAQHVGYESYIDMENRCVAFPHDKYFGNPLKADKNMHNGARCAIDLEALRLGKRSAKVPYLEERRCHRSRSAA